MDRRDKLRTDEKVISGARRAEGSFGFLCADLMTTEVAVVAPDETASSAAAKMLEQNLGFLPGAAPPTERCSACSPIEISRCGCSASSVLS